MFANPEDAAEYIGDMLPTSGEHQSTCYPPVPGRRPRSRAAATRSVPR